MVEIAIAGPGRDLIRRKFRRRYLVVEFSGARDLDQDKLRRAIEKSIISLFGELTLALSSPNLIEVRGNRAIIQTNHVVLERVRAALASMRRIGDGDIRPEILGVSGTIKRARKKYLEIEKPSLDLPSLEKEEILYKSRRFKVIALEDGEIEAEIEGEKERFELTVIDDEEVMI